MVREISELAVSVFFLVSAIGLGLVFAIPYMEVKTLYGFGYSWTTTAGTLDTATTARRMD